MRFFLCTVQSGAANDSNNALYASSEEKSWKRGCGSVISELVEELATTCRRRSVAMSEQSASL
jgi:hypothetical protein